MAELVFEVIQEADGGYCAECLTENIFTEGDTWEQLRNNVREATAAYFFDKPLPKQIRLHLVPRDVSGAHLADVLCRTSEPAHHELRFPTTIPCAWEHLFQFSEA